MKIKSAVIGFLSLVLFGLTPTNLQADSAPKQETVTLTSDNLLVLDGPIMPETIGEFLMKARELDAKLSSSIGSKLKYFSKNDKPLYVYMYTPGGSIQTGFEMNEELKSLGRPVHTITAFSASMGFQTVQSLGDRLILQSGVLMSHRAKGGFEGEFGGQHPSQIDSRYSFWLSRLNEMDAQTVARSNGKQTMESYQKQYASEMWLTGQQAVDQGYADRVVKVKCDASLQGTNSHTVSFLGIINISYDTDKCPLNQGIMNVRVEIPTNKGNKDVKAFIDEGGGFGNECLLSGKKDALCALNPNLDLRRIEELKAQFLESKNYKNHVIPLDVTL